MDPADIGSWTEKILWDHGDPGSSFGKVLWNLADLRSYTTIYLYIFKIIYNQIFLLVPHIYALLKLELC